MSSRNIDAAAGQQQHGVKMILRNLSVDLAALYARELLIGGWTQEATLAAIRYLDQAKPLQRRMAVVRWALPQPRVAEDPLVDENGDRLINVRTGAPKLRGRLSDLNQQVESRAIARERDRKAAAERKRKEHAAGWAAYDAGQREAAPRYARPKVA